MRRTGLRAVFAAAALLLAGSAIAQGRGEFRGGTPGDFDYYILALSWSPTFCAFEGGRKGGEQCAPGRRLGFVVHGLWPQRERGRIENCGAFERPPSRMALEEAAGVFPSEGLVRHEWRKHGTCTGNSPAEYFRDARRAWEKLRIPDGFGKGGGERLVSKRDIERAFVEANPGLRGDMIAVTCRRNTLQEVRICFERDLGRFRSCPQIRSNCPLEDIVVTGAP
jgi:ribonuclease T2